MASFDELWNQNAAPKKSAFDELWDQTPEPMGPKAPPDPISMMAGRAVQGAADALGGVNSFLKDRGINTEGFFQPAREAARTQNALGAAGKFGAGASGILDTFDSLINAPVGAIQQAQGIAPAKRWRSDTAGIVESIPQVADAKAILPEAFNTYKTAAGFLAPLPGGGGAKAIGTVIPVAKYWAKAAKEGSKTAQIWDMAATGGLIGGAMTAGARVKANKEIDPLEALGGTVLGAGLGGGAGFLGHKAGETFEQLWNKIPKRKPPSVATDVNGQILPPDPNMPGGMMDANHLENSGLINREALDADDLLALDQLQGKVLPPAQGLRATEAPPLPAQPQKLVAEATAPPAEPVRLANQAVPQVQADPTMPLPESVAWHEYDMKQYGKAYEPLDVKQKTIANDKVREGESTTYYDGTKAQQLTDAQLESYWVDLEAKIRRQGTGRATKETLVQKQNIINTEVLRRKDRIQKGWEQNWAKDPNEPDFSQMSTDDLHMILTGQDENAAAKAFQELDIRENARAPQAPEIVPPAEAAAMPPDMIPVEKPRVQMPLDQTQANLMGDRRNILDVDANGNAITGRERVRQAPTLNNYSDNVLSPEMRTLKTEYAKAKVAEDYHRLQLEDVSAQALARFGKGADQVAIDGMTLTKRPDTVDLTKAGNDAKNLVKSGLDQEFPPLPVESKGGGVRATLDERSTGQIPKVSLPEDLSEKEVADIIRWYKSEADAAAANRTAVRDQFYGPEKNDLLLEAQGRLREELRDPNAHLQSSIAAEGPDGQLYNVLVEAQNERIEMPLLWEQFSKAKKEVIGPRGGKNRVPQTEEEFFGDYLAKQGYTDTPYQRIAEAAKANFQKLEEAIAEITKVKGNTTTRTGKIGIKDTAQLVGAFTGFGLMTADQSAQAATVTDPRGNPVIGTGALVGMGLILASGASRFGPNAIKQFAKWSGARAASIYKDTLDHVDYLDKLVSAQAGPFNNKNLAGNPTTMMKPLGRSIWEHNAGAIMSNWGIDWSKNIKGAKWDGQTTKARSLAMLRAGAITTKDALSGKAGTVFEEMTTDQRKAAVGYFMNQKTLAYKINRFEQDLRSIGLMDNPDRDTKDALAAFDYLKQSVAPKSKAFDEGIVDAYHKGLSNAMDFYFFMNPKHHLLNLTDSFIGGGSRVGATRIAKAWKWLATDKDIQGVFKNANIVGSYRAEQIDMAAKSANARNLFQHDFASDQVNAERVALGSIIQYAEDNAVNLQKNGFKGDSKQFVKDLFNGTLDPTQSMDASVHMAETLSRTLGVDPYRVNTDMISRQKVASALGVFIKQPARISRLAFNYAKKGEYGKLATMMGTMAIFGGSAAIPVELKQMWESTDPNSYFKVAGALDTYNPYTMITGQNAAKKLEWGITPLGFATTNPAVETAKELPGELMQLKQEMVELSQVPGGLFEGITNPRMAAEREQVAKKLQKFMGGLMQIALNRVPVINAPTGEGSRLVKQLSPAVTGETPITYYRGDDRFAPSENVKLDKLGLNRLNPVLNTVLPGEMGPVYRRQNAVYEEKVRQKTKQRVPQADMGYNDPLMQMANRR